METDMDIKPGQMYCDKDGSVNLVLSNTTQHLNACLKEVEPYWEIRYYSLSYHPEAPFQHIWSTSEKMARIMAWTEIKSPELLEAFMNRLTLHCQQFEESLEKRIR